MTKNTKIVIAVILIIIILGFVYYKKSDTESVVVSPTPISPIVPTPTPVATGEVMGCYVATLAKDVYTLDISKQEGENVEGRLAFKNFEKDSSSGSFKGTYKNGILIGDYTFNSEGSTSVMQVAFKKTADGFARGYGDMNADGTRFADVNKLTYDSAYTFKPTSGACVTS